MNWDGTIVGLIPAGGKGERIAPLPCSKELFPIGFQYIDGKTQPRTKVVCHYLMEMLQSAGITQTYIVLRKGKWDIPAYFGDGKMVKMCLAYLVIGESFGPPFTLDQAFPFIRNKIIAFGFPDIIISADDVFRQLIERQTQTHADVVLALFPSHNPQIMDMVNVGSDGKVQELFVRSPPSSLTFTWLCGIWTPVFTRFMHDYLQEYRHEKMFQVEKVDQSEGEEITVGVILQAAIKKGLEVNGVMFPNGKYIDVGTPEALVKSVGAYGSYPS